MSFSARDVKLFLTGGLIVALVAAGCDSSNPVALDDQGSSSLDLSADMHATPDGAALTDGDTPDISLPSEDALLRSDAEMGFPQVLEGVWLVGWIGGLNRFSWVRFTITSATGGTAEINAGDLLGGGTVPYWDCSGAGSWNVTAEANTIVLHYPSSECTGMRSENFTFASIVSFTESYPKGALLAATIEAWASSPSPISGYKFPLHQCAPDMSGCMDPL